MPNNFLSQGLSSVIVIIIAVFLFLFWVNMLVDCARRDFSKKWKKVFWLLLLIFLQTIAAFIYWLTIRRQRA